MIFLEYSRAHMADDLFTSRLLKGEHILWSGNPGRGLLLSRYLRDPV